MQPIRIGMVGLGIMGRRYYRMLQDLEGVEVTALCVRHLDAIQDLPGVKCADYRHAEVMERALLRLGAAG
jgi:predicted dehydrogenase